MSRPSRCVQLSLQFAALLCSIAHVGCLSATTRPSDTSSQRAPVIAPSTRLTIVASPSAIDTGGTSVDPLAGPADALVAIVFISHECPIANAMAPNLRALAQHANDRAVAFHLVHSTSWVDLDTLRRHARDFGYDSTVSVLTDPAQTLARATGATITPEAALLRLDGRGHGRLLYLGRVNDLYAGIGRRKPTVTSNDLRDAIDAAVEGHDVPKATASAVGCLIEFGGAVRQE